MKKGEVINLFNAINSLGEIKSTKLSYAILKNIDKIKGEIDIIQKLQQAKSPKHQEFEDKRIKLCEDFSEKDESGKAIMIGNNYKIIDQDAFDKMYGKLEGDYPEVMQEIENKIKEINDILEEESEIELHKVSLEYLPQELTPAQVKSLMPMIMEG